MDMTNTPKRQHDINDKYINHKDDDNIDSPTSLLQLLTTNYKETPWIDAWIRWERDSKDTIDFDDDNDDQESTPPTKTFVFDCHLPTTTSQNNDELLCTLTLQGYPSESEQIWNSTGLTLWPCSQYLCDYLCHNIRTTILHDKIDGRNRNNKSITVVELGSGLGRCGLLVHHLL
jgi:hypothetical protein